MKKRLLAATLMLATFTGTAAALSSYTKNIPVEYGISLQINDQTPQLTDAAGKPVQPFVYDGTTYVPMRAVSENLGAKVSFDASTNTAYIVNDSIEILTALFMLKNTASDLNDATSDYLDGVSNYFAFDLSASQILCEQAIATNRTMLAALSRENSMYSILTTAPKSGKSLLDGYNSCVEAYNTTNSAYVMLSSNTTSQTYLDQFLAGRKEMIDAYFWFDLSVDTFLKTFNWRDLTNLT